MAGRPKMMVNKITEMEAEAEEEFAQELGMNIDKFKLDIAAATTKQKIDADVREAASLGITSTPAFLINGKYTSGAKPFEQFKTLIDAALNES